MILANVNPNRFCMLLTPDPSSVMFERPQPGSIPAAGVKEMVVRWAGPGELAPLWSLQGRVYCWSGLGGREPADRQ